MLLSMQRRCQSVKFLVQCYLFTSLLCTTMIFIFLFWDRDVPMLFCFSEMVLEPVLRMQHSVIQALKYYEWIGCRWMWITFIFWLSKVLINKLNLDSIWFSTHFSLLLHRTHTHIVWSKSYKSSSSQCCYSIHNYTKGKY
jgi:hypothetical protein